MSKPSRILFKEVARLMDTSNIYAQRMVNAVMVGILKEILENKKCSLLNFGLFYLHTRKSYRIGFNKDFIIPPTVQLSFHASKSIKKLVNKKNGKENGIDNGTATRTEDNESE